MRELIRQVCAELGIEIIKGVLSKDHVHMFIAVPPQHALSDVMRRIKGRSSRRIQQEFPEIKKRYWGCHFWARGYFSATSGCITEDLVLQYLNNHINDPHMRIFESSGSYLSISDLLVRRSGSERHFRRTAFQPRHLTSGRHVCLMAAP